MPYLYRKEKHNCNTHLPNPTQEYRDGVDVGSIFKCTCGKLYELVFEDRPASGASWRSWKGELPKEAINVER